MKSSVRENLSGAGRALGSLPRCLQTLLLLVGMVLPAVAGAEPPFTVGFAQDTLQNDWRIQQVEQFRAAMETIDDLEVVVEVRDARGSAVRQARDMMDLAERGVDVLVTSPRDGELKGPVVAEIEAAGIPVVLLTRRVTGNPETAFVGMDDRQIGQQAAAFIIERLGGRGRVLMLEGVPGATTTQGRTEGFLDRLRQAEGVEVVYRAKANFLRGDALRATETALREGVEFDAIYAQSDSMATGARLALMEAGHDPANWLIVGIDFISEASEAIRASQQTASFTYPTAAAEGAELVERLLRGQSVPRETWLSSDLVTIDNLDDFEPIF